MKQIILLLASILTLPILLNCDYQEEHGVENLCKENCQKLGYTDFLCTRGEFDQQCYCIKDNKPTSLNKILNPEDEQDTEGEESLCRNCSRLGWYPLTY